MLSVERRTQLLQALRHNFPPDEELDLMLITDIDAIEPLIEAWIEEARAPAWREKFDFEKADSKP